MTTLVNIIAVNSQLLTLKSGGKVMWLQEGLTDYRKLSE